MKLTRRQRDVVALLTSGLTCPQIAKRLGLRTRTIRGHVERIAGALPGKQPPIRRIIQHAAMLLAA